MISVFRVSYTIYIQGQPQTYPAGSLVAMAMDSDIVAVTHRESPEPIVASPYELMTRQDGTPFASQADCLSYLNQQFAPIPLLWQDVLTITTQNIIPQLTYPYKKAIGGFCNIVAGANCYVSGFGVVVYMDGSTTVTFDPNAAGFNLNPGEVVIAQYSY